MWKIKQKWREIPLGAKVSVAYALCSIIQRFISFFTMPIFTRLLTQEQYGQYIVYQSWMGILSIFLTLNLAYGSFSTAMIKYEEDREGYISSVEGICLTLTFLFLMIYFPFRIYWNHLFELPTIIVCILILEILSTTAIQLWSGKKRFEFKYKAVIAVTLFISFISPLFTFYLVKSSVEKGYARIAGYAIINCIVGMIFYVFNAIKGKKVFNKEYWIYALQFNVPLLIYYLSQVVFNQSDRLMISHMVGKDKAAIYGVAYSLATILTFVLNAVNNAYVPWLYERIRDNKQDSNRSVSVLIALLMAFLLTGVIWFAPEIIIILGGMQYIEAIYVIPPVAISVLLLFYSQLFINVEFYYEERKQLVYSSIGSALANLLLNWIYIKRFGYIAAAYTTLVSYIIFAFCNYFGMKKVLKKNKLKDNAYNYKELIMILVLFLVITCIGTMLYQNLLLRVAILLVLIFALFIKRQSIILCYKSIRER